MMRPKRNSRVKKQNRGNSITEIKSTSNVSSSTIDSKHVVCQHQSSNIIVSPIDGSSKCCRAGLLCSGCNKLIKRDKFVLRACDKYWHESCLKCDKCQAKLAELGNTLYCKSSMHLCRHDYLELFGPPGICSVCNKMIRAYEMVMKARSNVYHLECFACQLCNLRFYVGERFHLWENKIVCQYDYEEHVLQLDKSPSDVTPAKETSELVNPGIMVDLEDQNNLSDTRLLHQLCNLDASSYSNCVT